jgi:hypothetical protein
MASETTASHNSQTPPASTAKPLDPPEVDDGLMSSQRQRYLMALEEEREERLPLGGMGAPPDGPPQPGSTGESKR